MKVEGSGRKKGTPNKKTQSLEDRVESLGIDPFAILLAFAGGDKEILGLDEIQAELRFKAAREVCGYLYPKRKSIEVISHDEKKVENIEEFIARLPPSFN